LPGLIREFQPDIIQVESEPWSAVYLQVVFLRRLLVPKAILCFFSWWNTPDWGTPLHFPGSILYKIGLNATDRVICGNHGAAQLHREHGFHGLIEVIPLLGADTGLFYPDLPDANILSRHGMDSDFIIGFVGRLNKRKGIATLLEAVARLEDRNWRLLIVGDGPQKSELTAMAHDLGIIQRIVFAGAVPMAGIAHYMRVMNLLVLPSTKEQWEQFGQVLVEAMACGVPVVGSNSGEIPYVIDNRDLVFPMGDSISLHDKIVRFMKEPGFAEAVRARGLQRVQENYSTEIIARKLYAFYQASLNHFGLYSPPLAA
jgi:glycosyltransferase involved in cell wall biosynthesis